MNSGPLPERIRPDRLKDFIGQKHLAGKEGIVRKLIENEKKENFFPSLIFWGSPGSGKTTLARIIANELDREFYEFSAVNTSSKDLEEIINKYTNKQTSSNQLLLKDSATKEAQTQKTPPIIFLDEIHRFNKAQQDKLLPHVEKGTIVLIGATTENPSFEVIGPLLSRSRVLTFSQLDEKDLEKIIQRGIKKLSSHPNHYSKPEILKDEESIRDKKKKAKPSDAKDISGQSRNDQLKINKKAKEFLIEASNGDARATLVVLEIAANLSSKNAITIENVEQALQRRQLSFDKHGEEHHNTISAFIKSMRANNVDAALYYLARMVEAGQDPLYVARRMVIFASEDIGMAQPTALVVANEVFKACEVIGYPECAINLAHGTVYLASAKKDRSAYDAFFKAVDDVKRYGNLPIPKEILNAPTDLMKELGYGKGYKQYTKKDLLPDKLKGKKYYED